VFIEQQLLKRVKIVFDLTRCLQRGKRTVLFLRLAHSQDGIEPKSGKNKNYCKDC